jgi:hypothetical protein
MEINRKKLEFLKLIFFPNLPSVGDNFRRTLGSDVTNIKYSVFRKY